MEVDEQTKPESDEPQISNDLGFVDRKEPLYRFDLDDEAALDDKIQAIPAIERKAFVMQRDRDLALEAKSTKGELVRQTVFIGRFEQPRSKMAVDFDAGADDLTRKSILSLFLCSSLFHFRVFGHR